MLRHFAERAGISYPLLADPDSEIIRKFGILDEDIEPNHAFYGIPHPGQFLLDGRGVIHSKYFEENYRNRYMASGVLVRELGTSAGHAKREYATDHLKAVTWGSSGALRGGQRVALGVDIELPPAMHVYAPGVDGYTPIELKLQEVEGLSTYPAEYPESEELHLPAIDETVPVYEGSFRLLTDIMIGQPKEIQHLLSDGQVSVRGELLYQACDDKICYLPQAVPLEWTFPFEEHDKERVPPELRRPKLQ